MRLVVVESPYAGDVARNLEYARAAMLDCLQRQEAPFASHLLYTQVLNDDSPVERWQGIQAGIEYHKRADCVVFYLDLGLSEGMTQAILNAAREGVAMEFRFLEGWG